MNGQTNVHDNEGFVGMAKMQNKQYLDFLCVHLFETANKYLVNVVFFSVIEKFEFFFPPKTLEVHFGLCKCFAIYLLTIHELVNYTNCARFPCETIDGCKSINENADKV